MLYTIEFLPEAERSLARLSPDVRKRVMKKIERLRNDLAGDVKRLSDFEPEWRLRVGDWRVLFDLEGQSIVIWRVVHRSAAYDV